MVLVLLAGVVGLPQLLAAASASRSAPPRCGGRSESGPRRTPDGRGRARSGPAGPQPSPDADRRRARRLADRVLPRHQLPGAGGLGLRRTARQSDWCADEPRGPTPRPDQRTPYVWLDMSRPVRTIGCPAMPASLLTEHVEARAPGPAVDYVEGAVRQGELVGGDPVRRQRRAGRDHHGSGTGRADPGLSPGRAQRRAVRAEQSDRRSPGRPAGGGTDLSRLDRPTRWCSASTSRRWNRPTPSCPSCGRPYDSRRRRSALVDRARRRAGQRRDLRPAPRRAATRPGRGGSDHDGRRDPRRVRRRAGCPDGDRGMCGRHRRRNHGADADPAGLPGAAALRRSRSSRASGDVGRNCLG